MHNAGVTRSHIVELVERGHRHVEGGSCRRARRCNHRVMRRCRRTYRDIARGSGCGAGHCVGTSDRLRARSLQRR